MNLYVVIMGEYSDRSETWYSHPENMTPEQFDSLLWNTWKNVTRPRREQIFNESNAVCLEMFGVSVDEIPPWILYYAQNKTLSNELFQGIINKGTVEQLYEFCNKYSQGIIDLTSLLMKDAGFTEVIANASIHLTPHWRQEDLEDFEKDLSYEVNNDKTN